MKDEIKPVNRAHEASLNQHGQLLNDMRRLIRSKAEGEAEQNDIDPLQLFDHRSHRKSIPHNPGPVSSVRPVPQGLKA